MIAIAIVAQS